MFASASGILESAANSTPVGKLFDECDQAASKGKQTKGNSDN